MDWVHIGGPWTKVHVLYMFKSVLTSVPTFFPVLVGANQTKVNTKDQFC